MPIKFYLWALLALLLGTLFLVRIWRSEDEEVLDEVAEEVIEEAEEIPEEPVVSPEIRHIGSPSSQSVRLSRGDIALYVSDRSPVPTLVEVLELREDWALIKPRKGGRLPFAASYTALYVPVEHDENDFSS